MNPVLTVDGTDAVEASERSRSLNSAEPNQEAKA